MAAAQLPPRAYTEAEVTDMLLTQMRALAQYWAVAGKSAADACDGVVFSILALLDGSGMVLPAFKLVLDPHPDDQAFNKGQGENWFAPGMALTGPLHEQYYARTPT